MIISRGWCSTWLPFDDQAGAHPDDQKQTPSFSCLPCCSKIGVKIIDTDVRTASFFVPGSVRGLVQITSKILCEFRKSRCLFIIRISRDFPAGVCYTHP